MTQTTAPATPGSTTAAPIDLEQEIKNILSAGETDVEKVTSKIMSLVSVGENSTPVTAFKSFIGDILKSGRGGACLGIMAAMGASVFLPTEWMWYGAGVIAALAVTAPTATTFYTSNTKGEPVWALVLMAIVAAVVGGAALWAFDHVSLSVFSGLVSKL